MSTAGGRDGGRTQSGGIKGVIAPDPDLGMAEPENYPREDDFEAARRALVFLSTYLTCLYSMLHFFTAAFFCFIFIFSTSRVSSVHGLAFCFGWRANVVYVCSSFIWT